MIREIHFQRHVPRAEIAKAMGRTLSSMCRLLAQKHAPSPVGRPCALSENQVDKLCQLVDKLVDKADALYEISLAMIHNGRV